ncbi:hypothetical protein [Reichenbachiella versicolor]|uniref:hypothetical protein n=1 Tax=Reichenbachiella versicolor TaxID=1821036 RepID=UPI000D6EA4D2|nr:hypothetical protein [Reichenbachiella versicolor]
MLKNLHYYVFVALIAFGCASAKKLYEQGNYYQAVIKAADKLRSNSDHKKTLEALKTAYPLAVENELDQIRRVKASSPAFQNSEAVYSYERLNHMYDEIRRSPGARSVISAPVSYYDELGKVKSAAAEEQYQAGLKELAEGRRENGKRAYSFFQKANQFVPNYKDATAKMDEAYQMAVLKVFVDIKPVNSQQYKLSSDFFYDQVKLVLREVEQNDFIRFYTPIEAERLKLDRPHQVLVFNFVDFTVGKTHQLQRVEKVERDSVVVGSVKLDDGTTKDAYNTVSAKLTINRMEVVSNGIVRMEVIDETSGSTLKKDDFGGEYIWFNEWGNFNGDERALTKEQIQITKNQQVMPPPVQDLFVEFTRPIFSQVRAHLIGFYRGY